MILQKLLGFDPKTMRKRTEVVAGATTFLTMCYILAVNPTILSTTGMDRGALFTSTAIAAAIATLLLAFMAKLPLRPKLRAWASTLSSPTRSARQWATLGNNRSL